MQSFKHYTYIIKETNAEKNNQKSVSTDTYQCTSAIL